jgi:branched-chain amino acid transport system permease protein
LGVYIVLQNVISLLFGDDTKSIRTWPVREGWNIFGARITPVQVIIIASAVVLFLAVIIFLKWTKIGKAMRAVASDPDLALISGINVNNVILFTFAIGSALAGIAGILVSLDVDMTPTMGMHALLMGVVAVIIGGRNSIVGVALGALLLGMAQHLGTWWISSKWQDAIAFVILLIFLLFRPQGFFGKKLRTAHV